jgi:hypothetical protein
MRTSLRSRTSALRHVSVSVSVSFHVSVSVSFLIAGAAAPASAQSSAASAPDGELVLIAPPASDLGAPADPGGTSYALDAAGEDLELADIDRRSSVASALYVSSVALGMSGIVGLLVTSSLMIPPGTDTYGPEASVLVGVSALCLVGHVVTMVIAGGIDGGSAARRRRHAEASGVPQISAGPGDLGAGLRIPF